MIRTEQDYEYLIKACEFLVKRNPLLFDMGEEDDLKYQIDYDKYLNLNFTIQEYIPTPSEYNTTVRMLTSSSNDLLYASLKYNKPSSKADNTTLLGYLLSEIYPLSTKTIVSNTLSGGNNVLINGDNYTKQEDALLKKHNINSDKFAKLVELSQDVHNKYQDVLGIICGFDYIYDCERDKWFLLEYHSRPMVGDYSVRQGIKYTTKAERLSAEGRVRATALKLTLKKNR